MATVLKFLLLLLLLLATTQLIMTRYSQWPEDGVGESQSPISDSSVVAQSKNGLSWFPAAVRYKRSNLEAGENINDNQTLFSSMDNEAAETTMGMLNASTPASPDLNTSLSKLLVFAASKNRSQDWTTVNTDLLRDEVMPNKSFIELLKSVVNTSDVVVSNVSLTDLMSESESESESDYSMLFTDDSDFDTAFGNLSSMQTNNTVGSLLVTLSDATTTTTITAKPTTTTTNITTSTDTTTDYPDFTYLLNLISEAQSMGSVLKLCPKKPEIQKLCSHVEELEKQCLETGNTDTRMCSMLRSEKDRCSDLPKLEKLCSIAQATNTLSF